MNKKIIAFMAMVLFLSAISYSEDRALTRRDYVEIIKQKDEEIAKLKTELMEKAKLLKQKDEEINRLKELCHKSGINASPPSEEKVVPEPSGKIKIIDKPIFGVRLGEDIEDLQKRFSLESIPANEWEEITKVYIVKNQSSEVKDLRVWCFGNKVYAITVFLTDSSKSNFNAIAKKIKDVYEVTKETKTEKPISLGGHKFYDLEYNFLVRIDGEDVAISVLLGKTPKELEEFGARDDLSIFYEYKRLNALVEKEYENKRTLEKENERKKKEASKKRLSYQL